MAKLKEYIITKVNSTPDWSKLPSLEIDTPYFETPNDIFAHAQIAYDDNALYVHLWAEEKDVRAVEEGLLGSPCEDSCLEFFFCPMENDNRYFNIEYNSNGCLYLGFAGGIKTLVRLVVPRIDELFCPKIERKENGWDIKYQIPYSLVRRFFPDFKAEAGKTIRANCFKCADLTTPPHYLSWNPVETENFTYHKPEFFGKMVFSK